MDDDGAILRWEGGQMVERVDLDYDFDFGARYLDTWAALSIFGDEEDEMGLATLVNLERDNAGVLFEVPVAGDSPVVHPTLEGGMHVLGESGALSTYDSDGRLVAEVNTPAERPYWITMDPHSGKLAVAAQLGVTVEFAPVSRSVMIIEPKTGETEQVPGFDLIWNLGFARDGELLAITNVDGTVRLWDVERGASAGLVWDGSGAQRPGSPSWYDEATESIWVASSGKLLQILVDPERWIERACKIVGRDLTQDEWDRFVPGGGPVQSACGT